MDELSEQLAQNKQQVALKETELLAASALQVRNTSIYVCIHVYTDIHKFFHSFVHSCNQSFLSHTYLTTCIYTTGKIDSGTKSTGRRAQTVRSTAGGGARSHSGQAAAGSGGAAGSGKGGKNRDSGGCQAVQGQRAGEDSLQGAGG